MTTSDRRSAQARALPSLPARLIGVLTSPRASFEAVVAAPSWLGMLALTTGVAVLLNGAFLSTAVGRQALLDQQVASAESFGVRVTDERYEAMGHHLGTAAFLRTAAVAAGIPIGALVGAGMLLGAFRGAGAGRATYGQVLAVLAHSGAVLVVRDLVVTPLNYARESMSSPANLSAFLPMLDEGSFLASFLGSIELFLVWWIVVLAIGLSVLFRRKTTAIAASLGGAYGVVALALAALKTALGGQ